MCLEYELAKDWMRYETSILDYKNWIKSRL